MGRPGLRARTRGGDEPDIFGGARARRDVVVADLFDLTGRARELSRTAGDLDGFRKAHMQVTGRGIGVKNGCRGKGAGQGAGAFGRREGNRPASNVKRYTERRWVWFIRNGGHSREVAERGAFPGGVVGHRRVAIHGGGLRAIRERLSRHERDHVGQARNF